MGIQKRESDRLLSAERVGLTLLGCLGLGLTLMYTSSCSISWVMRPATPHITHQHQVDNLSVTQVHISAHNTNTRIRTYLQERMHTASPSDSLLVVNLSPVLTVHLLTNGDQPFSCYSDYPLSHYGD